MVVAAPPSDPVRQFAEAAVAGDVLVGELVHLAAARHLHDLETGPARGLVWDAVAAEHACRFFPDYLRLAEGGFAGQPFELQLWQQFIVGSLFGWYLADGTRRFRTAYIECAKGSHGTFATGSGPRDGFVSPRDPRMNCLFARSWSNPATPRRPLLPLPVEAGTPCQAGGRRSTAAYRPHLVVRGH